uniref:hypothetical protein n=1 Tax=Methanobrevibacter sp. TaxID=66852 RepID=UPI003863A130
MKFIKTLMAMLILALLMLFVINAGFANDNSTLEEHDFDSYFKMKVPKGIQFEKSEAIPTKNINLSVNYRNDTEMINIVYAQSAGAKEELQKYYEDFAKNNTNITLNSINNTTIIHFNGKNIIGEINF